MTIIRPDLPGVGNVAALQATPQPGPTSATGGVEPAGVVTGGTPTTNAGTPGDPGAGYTVSSTWHDQPASTGNVVFGRSLQVAGGTLAVAGIANSIALAAKHRLSLGGVAATVVMAGLGAGMVYEGQRQAKGDATLAGTMAMTGSVMPWLLGGVGVALAARGVHDIAKMSRTLDKVEGGAIALAGAAWLADSIVGRAFPAKFTASGTAGTLTDDSNRELAAPESDTTNPPPSKVTDKAQMPDQPAVQQAVKSTVRIFDNQYGPGIAGIGSGWTAEPDTIVTNAHVVANSHSISVRTQDGRNLPGTVVQFDPVADLAVVHVDHLGLQPLALDDTVETGEQAATIGYPNDHFLVRGATARESIQIDNDRGTRQVIELDGDIDHGNSGGAVVNGSGEVIGTVFSGQPHVFVLALPNGMVRAELAVAHGKTAAVDTRVPYGTDV